MELIHPKDFNEYKKKVQEKKLTIVKFTASWCGPCKTIQPKLDELAAKFANKTNMQFFSIDVDSSVEIAESENVAAMPSIVIYVDGKETDRIVGANFEKIQAALESHIAELQI